MRKRFAHAPLVARRRKPAQLPQTSIDGVLRQRSSSLFRAKRATHTTDMIVTERKPGPLVLENKPAARKYATRAVGILRVCYGAGPIIRGNTVNFCHSHLFAKMTRSATLWV